MKRKEPSTEKPKRGFNPDKFRRHYVSAVEDDASITEEEKGNLGRIFTFLLLLHVFLIGAVVLYNLIAEKPKSEFAIQTTTKPKEAAKSIPSTAAAVVVPLEDMNEYFVRSGQNLQDISDATGATKEQLIAVNHLDENGELFVGRKLIYPKPKAAVVAAIPVPEPVPAPSAAKPAPVAAAVQPAHKQVSETFAAVEPGKAATHDAPPKEFVAKTTPAIQESLPESKPKDAKPAAPVVKVKPPEAKPVAKTATPAPVKKEPVAKPKEVADSKPAPAKKGGIHEVKPKETFYSIARRYGVSVDQLMKVNGIKNASALRDGTKLKIPASS